LLFNSSVLSQSGKKDTTYIIPHDIYKIQYQRTFSILSDTISVQDYIWNDKRNLGEILFDRNGYNINYLSEGGRNTINYIGSGESNIGIFKDGVQQNDIFFGGYDIENISLNEIALIEEVSDVMSFLYGFNTRKKAVNIISKNDFRPYMFTQLRYSQDRHGALSADAYFNIPFSKKFNIILATGSHGSDGRYQNSDFSLWRSRAKINYYNSPEINFGLDFNYSKLKRGLNEGLEFSSDDTLSNEILANIVNPDSYDKAENFFVNFNIISAYLKKENLTQINVYTLNTLREFRDEENRTNPNGTYIKNNFHYIRYGLDIKQNLKVNFAKNISAGFLIGGNGYQDFYNYNPLNTADTGIIDIGSNLNYIDFLHYSVYSRFDMNLADFYASAGIRNDFFENTPYLQYGAEGGYNFIFNSKTALTVFGGFNSTVDGFNYYKLKYPSVITVDYFSGDAKSYIESGLKLRISDFRFKLKLNAQDYSGKFNFENGNFSAEYLTERIEGKLYIDKFKFENYPEVFIKSDICYHDYFFDNHLNLKVGVNIKYATSYIPVFYSQYRLESFASADSQFERDYFNIDAYIGARIGSANLTLTFENLLDKVNYTASLFPFNERGGLANILSRLTITWDYNY
jgi:hypothetical protein